MKGAELLSPSPQADAEQIAHEHELLRKAKMGDEEGKEALGELFQMHQGRLFGQFYNRLGDASLAHDFTQELSIRFLKVLPAIEPRGNSLAPYLQKTAANMLANWWRDQGRQKRKAEYVPIDTEEIPEREDHNPEKLLVDKENQHMLRKTISRAVAELPSKDQKKAIVLRYYSRWTVKKIARFLGKPENSVKALLHRGLVGIKESYKKNKEIAVFP